MSFKLATVSICALILIGCGEKKPRDVTQGGEETMAFIMCQTPVKNSLKSPSTAKFPYAHDDGVRIRHTGDGEYSVRGFVDAQNGFGAQLRTVWYCSIKETPDKKWKLLDLVFEK